MSQHTPGPWEMREIAHPETPFAPRRVYRVEIGSPLIDKGSKRRYGTHRVCQITDFGFISDPANARLIRSAPELLSAAKAALFVLRIVHSREPGTNEAGAIADLEDVIRKAERGS